MEKFSINKIIEYYNLDTDDLAKVLFPTVKYPKQAFDRIIKGEADLDIKQVENLASYIGVTVLDLFQLDTWKRLSENGYLIIIKGAYKAKLNYNGSFLSVYKEHQLIEQKIVNASILSLQEFITFLNNFIYSYEYGNNQNFS